MYEQIKHATFKTNICTQCEYDYTLRNVCLHTFKQCSKCHCCDPMQITMPKSQKNQTKPFRNHSKPLALTDNIYCTKITQYIQSHCQYTRLCLSLTHKTLTIFKAIQNANIWQMSELTSLKKLSDNAVVTVFSFIAIESHKTHSVTNN